MAALDINCRCALISVPRWDIEDTVIKRDNITGELIEAKDYAEWKVKYADVHKEYINAHPNKRIYLESDSEQYSRYLKVLGVTFVPKAVHDFTQLKANKEKWNDLKAKYRTVNRYKVDYGEVTASEILELDSETKNTKQKFTKTMYVNNGNIGVLKEEYGFKYAYSKIDDETDKAYKKFVGDKSSLLLLEEQRKYKTLKKGDLVDGVENTHDRASDSEAKMFEYLRK